MTPGLHRLLSDVANREGGARLGVTVEPCNDRATAVRLGLIIGRKMKVGHRKIYSLTDKGRRAVEMGRLD